MNRQAYILLAAGGAAVVMILLVALFAWVSGGTDAAADLASPANGSLLHPLVQREDRPGYVLAELYQDVHRDVDSHFYDADGVLGSQFWAYDEAGQTCSIDLVIADQHGRNEIAPTATPPPPDPTATLAPIQVAVLPAVYHSDKTEILPDRTIVYQAPTPTPTPVPDPLPDPTPTPTPVVTESSVWHHWKGRPLAIDVDGLAVIDVPKGVQVVAYLSVRTGADSGSAQELARLPMPDPLWHNGSAYVRLPDASGRILLAQDNVAAQYRSAVLHLEASPLSDCGNLRLRWQRPAAVVVKALTEQPFRDWQGGAAPPPTAGPPPPDRVAVYAAVGTDSTFDADDMKGGTHSTAAGHIVIPGPECGIKSFREGMPDIQFRLEDGQPCPVAEQLDGFIALAIRADLAPEGLSDIRQTGSVFNSRVAFAPDARTPGKPEPSVMLTIDEIEFKLYVTTHAWRASLLGGEWSLTP